MTTSLSPFAAGVNANIQAELARRNIAPGALSAQLGLSLDQIRRRRKGSTQWQLDEIAKIGAFLGLDPSALTTVAE